MYPKILHIYGPIYLNGYNLSLGIGIALFLYFASKKADSLKILSREKFVNIAVESTIFGIICARLLHVLSEYNKYKTFIEMISIWDGGLSVIGSIIGALGYAAWSLNKLNVSMLPVLDIGALYAPIIHAFGRIGCFLVGCCFGLASDLPWAITYTNEDIIAPLNIALHPTQLYSSAIYLIIFFVLQIIFNRTNLKNGQILMLYLSLSSLERLIVDYFRADRIFVNNFSLSFYQIIALVILLSSLFGFIFIHYYSKKNIKPI